ncbi:MAG TPA: cytochrome c oxidase accessory protein CcoG [Hyphomicrobium sp.]|nr:cytochrome c oxidase accessory protein CcoG [Hyphomicrobium sp.]
MHSKAKLTPDDFIVEAAPGVARHDVDAVAHRTAIVPGVDAGPGRAAFAGRQRVYSKKAKGTYRTVKWAIMVVSLAIYYLLPWIRWERGDGRPSQAFLLDFEHQKLYFGPLEIWAQEFYYITGLLVISALGLFLVTSVAGRVWCGYACPQTVWTDLMIAVERFWQGDRNAHMRLDNGPWTFEKIWKKTATHISWLLIGLLTGGALVFYFRDAPTLAMELVTGTAPDVAYAFLVIFAATTYLLGGIAREQVCIYMCPWPRIQGAMLDRNSLLVSYRAAIGEPRGPHKRGHTWDNRGDCVDCKACVAVCPMGIDIRNGAQLECIQCALCIDACDEIMDKVGRPRGLIDYTTEHNLASATAGPRDGLQIFRPRTLLYSALMTAIAGFMVWSLMTRADLEISVLADRNPQFVTLSDGSLRNGYTIKIVNKTATARDVRVTVSGMDGLATAIVGQDSGDAVIVVPISDVRAIKLFVTLPRDKRSELAGTSAPLDITVTDLKSGLRSERRAAFHGP